MAYRFDGLTARVEFAISPLSGYTSGAFTFAQFFKRGDAGGTDYLFTLSDSASNDKIICFIGSDNVIKFYRAGGSALGSVALSSTSLWYLCVFTVSAAGVVRCHLHDGTSWSHTNVGTLSGSLALISSDRMIIASAGGGSNFFNADIVCSGVKKVEASDVQVETLSRTSFVNWRSFGFDWLVGFDPSLVSGGLLQDQGTPGTGDEISKVGTSVVSDPPGWLWVPSGTMSKIKFGTGLGVTDEGSNVIRVDIAGGTSFLWEDIG